MQKPVNVIVALAASALLLTVIQAPFGLSALAWFAYVPFILASCPSTRPKSLAVAAYLVSLCYWLANLYWIAPVTWVGWLAFCLYTALLWPMLALGLRYCRIKKIPLVLAVPVLVVATERLQGLFLGGFFWRFLAHSQYANITLIQIADIFGAAGVSLLIGMVNGLTADWIIALKQKNIFKISNFLTTAFVCMALVAAVIYGRFRIAESGEFIEAGPLAASLQSNVPQSVKQSFQASDEIFDELMEFSQESAQAGAELIVWPETMVQATLDEQLLALLDSSHPYRLFDSALRKHSTDTAFVLVGAYGGEPEIDKDLMIRLAEKRNSAFLYQPDGRKAHEQYSKIHLVPFGEFIPFRKTFPFLYGLLMKFTPYDYDYSLDAGREYTVFRMTGGGETTKRAANQPSNNQVEGPTERLYRFSVLICYEDTVPDMARRFALGPHGQKQIDWLVNISNDGWFVRFKNGKLLPSTELSQHTGICVFRAVENRLPVLRSVNTGISCLIDSVGRIKNGFSGGSLPLKAMERQAVGGWFLERICVDKRLTFFTRFGEWPDFCCLAALGLLIIVGVADGILKRSRSKYEKR